MEFDFALVTQCLPLLIKGAGLTLQITALAVGIGLILGLILGMAQLSRHWFLHMPAKIYVDFIRGTPSSELGEVEPSYKPGVRLGDLAPSLPDYAIEAIREALPAFGKQIRGFDRDDAVLTGIETRPSAPRPNTRDTDTPPRLTPTALDPPAEGAGYAGGILSAGVDGIKVAEAVAKSILAGH